MSRAVKTLGLPLIAAALIAAFSFTSAFAQGGYGGGGGYSSGRGTMSAGRYMSGSGNMSNGRHMGSGYSSAPSYQPPSGGHSRSVPRRSSIATYIVRRGDTLASIARRFGVSIQAIQRANPAVMDINRIFVGQALFIPSRAVAFFRDGDRDADDSVSRRSEAHVPPMGAMPPVAAPYGNRQAPSQGYQPPGDTMPATPYSSPQAAAPAPAAPQPMTPPSSPPASSPQNVTINLIAHNLAFNMSTITVPAGAHVVVDFDNQDSGVPHNFAVYTDSSAQQAIFRGQIVMGPATTTYTFTAPSRPGTYFFRCDVHFTMMTGQFVVR